MVEGIIIIGIALWALIPGFIARRKGRSFWGYFFLSFLISPMTTLIIALCVSDANIYLEDIQKPREQRYSQCVKCGYKGEYFDSCPICSNRGIVIESMDDDANCVSQNDDDASFCRKCGHKLRKNSKFCHHCGSEVNEEIDMLI